MTPTDKKLAITAAAVAQSNPGAWQQLVMALTEYAQAQAHACVVSSAEEVHIAQGKARQSAQLVILFSDAVKTADRIEKGSTH